MSSELKKAAQQLHDRTRLTHHKTVEPKVLQASLQRQMEENASKVDPPDTNKSNCPKNSSIKAPLPQWLLDCKDGAWT